MSWIELAIDTTHEAVDWVRTLLAETDYSSEILITRYIPPTTSANSESLAEPEPWTFTLRLYLPYDQRANIRVDKIVTLLSPLHRTGLTSAFETAVVEEKPEADVEDAPVNRIGQRFVVLSPESSYQSAAGEEVLLRLQTSLAFGSGLHPATVISLQLLERHVVPSMHALDLGSGSGILSVAMAKLGATVLALDNDNVAVRSTQDAIRRNAVAHQVTAMQGSLGYGSTLGHWMGGEVLTDVPMVEAQARFDLIVANILARVHVALAEEFRQALRGTKERSGLLITAGFTTDHEDEVRTALTTAGFEAIDCERCQEWVGLVYQLQRTVGEI